MIIKGRQIKHHPTNDDELWTKTWRCGRGNIICGGGLAIINSAIYTNSVTVFGASDVVCEAIVYALGTFKEVTKC